jgi:membrane dipeptidase
LTRVTLVHLNNNKIGVTNSPLSGWRKASGLTTLGQNLVKVLDEERILVDLAHINEAGFWDAVREHDASLPLIVTHTGIASVTPHWRNISDKQVKAVAATGGTVGIMYQSSFLGDPSFDGKAASVIRHMNRVIEVAGEDFVSLGSDWDGAIITPKDMPTCTELPVLIQRMLENKWSEQRIQKVLAGNALRVLQRIRP